MILDALFSPRGVAVSGSTSPGKLGYVLINRLIEGGFSNIYAVNPKGQGCGDIKGYAKMTDIEGPVDMVVIASPATAVKDILEDAGQKGVKAAVIISSGFSEAGHKDLEVEMHEVAKKHGIRFIGPNCAGMANTKHNLLATLEAAPEKGEVALISQSGAVGGMIMSMSKTEGVGIGKFVSYGNGCDLNEIELLAALQDDPETKVIAMYLENIKRGREFMQVLRRVTRVKPVVIIKSGRTSSGQRAALSHTGSMAGADKVYDAAFAAAGAIRAESIEDMFDLCKGFSMLPPMKGKKLAIVTNSGGPGVMTADKCEEVGLSATEPDKDLLATLQSFLPAHAGLANPLDITVEGTAEQYGRTTAEALKKYDAAAVIYIGTPYLQALPVAQDVVKAAREAGKPVIGCFEIGVDIEECKAYLQAQNLPNFASGERGVRVLSKMAAYFDYLGEEEPVYPEFKEEKIQSDLSALLEPEAMDLLVKHGVATRDYRFVKGAKEAVAAAKEIGYPVVMKVVSPQIIHKSDVGGVKLNLSDDAAVEKAYNHMETIGQGKDFRGVIICPMLPQTKEIIIGFNRDAQFGPVIVFGMGGIYTEVLKDITLRVAPVTKQEALKMIRSIKTYPLLAGVRGDKPSDIDSLAELLVKFSYLPFIYPELAEADLNPVFVYEEGKGALAADARLILDKK